jgi:hypothetical protein
MSVAQNVIEKLGVQSGNYMLFIIFTEVSPSARNTLGMNEGLPIPNIIPFRPILRTSKPLSEGPARKMTVRTF